MTAVVYRGFLIGCALAIQSIFALGPTHAAGYWTITGKVIDVEDGDTLTILRSDHSRVAIRLSDIDAPEKSHGHRKPGQPFSRASKKSLASLAWGKEADLRCYEYDRWDRPVCTVFIDGKDVNLEQLRLGMAWVNGVKKEYVRNPLSVDAHAKAREASIGLWSSKEKAVEPWVWRRVCWKNQSCDGAGD